MTYKVKLEVFEGPLDLLLYLIKRDELDISDIPIAQITDQYLAYLDLMRLLDLDIAGEFLVMAATLMQIKSRMLLPRPPVPDEEDEADPRAELARRLLEYQRFKEVADALGGLETQQRGVFSRPGGLAEVAETPEGVGFEATLFDLISAFSKILQEIPRESFLQIVREPFTVEQKIHEILHGLRSVGRVSFHQLFRPGGSRLEIVATFLAILELIRAKEILVRQRTPFGEIVVLRNPAYMRGDVASG